MMNSKSTLMLLLFTVSGIGLLCMLFLFGKVETNNLFRNNVAADVLAHKDNGEPIQPIVADNSLDPRLIALGKRLFHDTRLSADNTISCASCHALTSGGTDHHSVSTGIQRRQGERNAPTVFNCSLNYRQFWDGRAATLAEQVDGPLQGAKEMGSTWAQVAAKLRGDAAYVAAFHAIYPDGIQAGNIKNALVTFERSLTTPDSRFDRYLKGEKSALAGRAAAGYQLFKSSGCISCHQGVNMGGNMMQHFGVIDNRFSQGKRGHTANTGPLVLTDAKDTSPLFRVPSLRNVARTAPYFHDGSVASLSEAVEIMGISQLGRHFSKEEVASLAAFLESLTGKYQGEEL